MFVNANIYEHNTEKNNDASSENDMHMSKEIN